MKMIALEGMDWLPLSDDYIFKAVLTNPEAKIALMDLISVSIGQRVVNVQILNNELAISDVDEKNQRFDIFCTIDDGSQVNVEMQGSKLVEFDGGNDNIISKLVYYLADAHSGQKSRGVEYYKLVKTYQITFSMHTIYDDYEGFVSQGAIRREDGSLMADKANMIVVELNKIGDILLKPIDEMTGLEAWSAFLGYSHDENHRELIEGLMKKREAIAMAGYVLAEISRNPNERAKYLSRRKFETDNFSNLRNAELKGKIEGKIEMARIMKSASMLSIEQIAYASGLSLAEVKAL